jgi:poly-beta-1,6-N-acetyl-D-glucosamine synthase
MGAASGSLSSSRDRAGALAATTAASEPGSLSYAAITPVRSERENLLRLARCLDEQTVRPAAWIIVDNGSTDGSLEAARELEARLAWVSVVEIEGESVPRPGAPIVRAFHAGLRVLRLQPDVVVKLDADISFEPDYFARQLAAFEADPELGIAGGECLELQDGKWRPTDVTEGHVRGAVRAYRWTCLQDVLPLEEQVGWDGIDGWKADMRGWRTRMLPDLAFYHHRPTGGRDGGRTARWKTQGRACWYMGYRPGYLTLRAVHRARRDPAALAMVTGYVAAGLRRKPRYEDAEVRAYLRRRQGLIAAWRRARSAPTPR